MIDKAILQNLSALQDEEFLSPIDVEFCRFLMDVEPGIDEGVIWAACLTSKTYQEGDVCIRLEEYAGQKLFDEVSNVEQPVTASLPEWISTLKKSHAVGRPGDFKPLILDDDNRLYFHKSWSFEQNLVKHILNRAEYKDLTVDAELLSNGIARLFSDSEDAEPNWQKVAAAAAVYNRFTVISGGPGTGKTTTIVRLLALLLEQHERLERWPVIALAAPTGKAAARMEESITEAKAALNIDNKIQESIPNEAVTIHQLLGARRYSPHFKYDKDNPLPCDVVIIDEASMIDQALMNSVMNALPGKAKLILLGDKDQLSSVEAGAVMADICGDYTSNLMSDEMAALLQNISISIPDEYITAGSKPLIDNIILLKKSYRFKESSGIGLLARAINDGEVEQARAILTDASLPDATLVQADSYAGYLSMIVEQTAKRFKLILDTESPEDMLEVYSQFQILSPHRKGMWGTDLLNRQIQEGLKNEGLISPYDEWYTGKPVIINRNDYLLGLSNGDLGICAQDSDGNKKVFFKINDSVRAFSPSRLSDFSTAFVLTVHKSQGSEFENIWLALPDAKSKILSRELLYTAVTRARKSVAILGSGSVFCEGVEHLLARNSGLKSFLWSSS